MKKKLFLIFAVLLSFALVLSFVSAQLGVPHQFYGTVTYNGASAPNDVSVVAKINEVIVKETTTSDGKYGYDPLFLITDPDESRAGKTIIFYVNDIEASSFIFSNGKVTELNLAVNGPPIGSGSKNSGGSSSSGSSSSSSSSSSSIGENVDNTETGTNSQTNENQNVGGITGAAVGSSGSSNFLPLLILLVLIIVGLVLFFAIKRKRGGYKMKQTENKI